MDYIADVERIVHELKVERDTWQAVALQYKAAFEAQSRRLNEFQDICIATQAELENERALRRRQHASKTGSNTQHRDEFDAAEEPDDVPSFGTAVLLSRPSKIDLDWHRRAIDNCTNPLFHHVQHFIEEENYGTALVEVERLLRGPLSSKARAEGLLLKSNVLRAAGPGELYDALAACSEALELCDRLTELESFLPQIQYQRGILCHEMRMLHQTRETFSTVSGSDSLSAKANEHNVLCEDGLRVMKRRSGFDEHRTMSEELLVELIDKPDVSGVNSVE